MAVPLRLVVARFQEDISWLEDLPQWEPFVVQKDVDLPNEGREPASFLWAMQKLYDAQGRIAFVQGNPSTHCPHLRTEIGSQKPFHWLGIPDYISEADGSPWHQGLPVREKLKEWLGQDWDRPITFAAGGQFVIDAAQIRKHPINHYLFLQGAMSINQDAWVMERLWEKLLG